MTQFLQIFSGFHRHDILSTWRSDICVWNCTLKLYCMYKTSSVNYFRQLKYFLLENFLRRSLNRWRFRYRRMDLLRKCFSFIQRKQHQRTRLSPIKFQAPVLHITLWYYSKKKFFHKTSLISVWEGWIDLRSILHQRHWSVKIGHSQKWSCLVSFPHFRNSASFLKSRRICFLAVW